MLSKLCKGNKSQATEKYIYPKSTSLRGCRITETYWYCSYCCISEIYNYTTVGVQFYYQRYMCLPMTQQPCKAQSYQYRMDNCSYNAHNYSICLSIYVSTVCHHSPPPLLDGLLSNLAHKSAGQTYI